MQQHESNRYNLKKHEEEQMAQCSVWALVGRGRIKNKQQKETWKNHQHRNDVNRKEKNGIVGTNRTEPHKNLNLPRTDHLTYAAANLTKKKYAEQEALNQKYQVKKHCCGVDKYRVA
jgi:hypothetical protein